MGWLQKLVGRLVEAPGDPSDIDVRGLGEEKKQVTRAALATFAFGVEVRDHELGIVDHCARVALIGDWLGNRIGIAEADAYLLKTAARLHEIGLVSIPSDLFFRRAPLSPEELATVRDQARTGAAMARSMHHPRVALLIENQYADYRALEAILSPRDLLLAGILRVADVIAAVTWPRPYQDPLPPERQVEVLESGAGVLFHPVAVQFGVQLRTGAASELARPSPSNAPRPRG